MTDGHNAPAEDALTAAFHDADLWILSAPQERFDAYCAQVREEYAFVPQDAYRAGRTAVLRPFTRGRRSTAPPTDGTTGSSRPGATWPASSPACATDPVLTPALVAQPAATGVSATRLSGAGRSPR